MFAEAEENNLDLKVQNERYKRWYKCGLCEQEYHGVVRGALGWACWKTYLGRPEADWPRRLAMTQLGNGLFDARRYEEALSAREAELALLCRLGVPKDIVLVVQGNLASTYQMLGRIEEALNLYRDVYSEELKLYGRHNKQTLESASNYAMTLLDLERFEEAKILLHKVAPVAQRVCGAEHDLTLSLREDLSRAILHGESSAEEEKRQALRMLEDVAGVMRRVLGPAHPDTLHAQRHLEHYRGSH